DDRSSTRYGSIKDGSVLYPRYYPDWYSKAYVCSWERENEDGEGHYHPAYEYHFRDPILYDNTCF
ncbi:hypothetical protein ACJMK2_005256, partial [Sinanodonta woodiana]